MFGFVAKHRGIWPVAFICEALGVSRSGFYAWLTRRPSARSRRDEILSAKMRTSFADSDRTYGARRVWHDLLAAGIECGLHAIERLMRRNGLRARPRRRRLPIDLGDRSAAALSANVLDRGIGYLRNGGYQVLADWRPDAEPVDPATVDWQAVHEGRTKVHVRQLPGGDNFMGKVKFEFPNAQGIYLHDTPDKQLLRLDERQLSSGCVRLEDAGKMHRWLMGAALPGRVREAEKIVPLPELVPIYITYLTAIPNGPAIAFRDDPYGRDGLQLAAVDSDKARADRP